MEIDCFSSVSGQALPDGLYIGVRHRLASQKAICRFRLMLQKMDSNLITPATQIQKINTAKEKKSNSDLT